jgi:hypothetical protein
MADIVVTNWFGNLVSHAQAVAEAASADDVLNVLKNPTRLTNVFPAAHVRTPRTCCAAPSKRRTRRKAGRTRNAARYRRTSRKAISRPNAESLSTANRPAARSRP